MNYNIVPCVLQDRTQRTFKMNSNTVSASVRNTA